MQVANDHKVLVAAYNAPVRVLTATGVVVANVSAGMTLSFDPQAGGTSVPGCLLRKNDRYMVVDPGSPHILAEIRGPDSDLAKEVGSQVIIAGSAIPGATGIEGVQVVGETSLTTRMGPSAACVSAAKAVGATIPPGPTVVTQPPPPPPSHTNYTPYTPYIIGGVAVAGGAIGIIAATRGSKSN